MKEEETKIRHSYSASRIPLSYATFSLFISCVTSTTFYRVTFLLPYYARYGMKRVYYTFLKGKK